MGREKFSLSSTGSWVLLALLLGPSGFSFFSAASPPFPREQYKEMEMKQRQTSGTKWPLEVAFIYLFWRLLLKYRLPGLSLDPLDQPERWGRAQELVYLNTPQMIVWSSPAMPWEAWICYFLSIMLALIKQIKSLGASQIYLATHGYESQASFLFLLHFQLGSFL